MQTEPTLPYGGALEYQAQDPRFFLNISDPEAGGRYLTVVFFPEAPDRVVPDYLEVCYWEILNF